MKVTSLDSNNENHRRGEGGSSDIGGNGEEVQRVRNLKVGG